VLFAAAVTVLAGCKKTSPVIATSPPKPVQTTSSTPVNTGGPGLLNPARIANFSVEPSVIERGQAATLRWDVQNGSDVSIDQGIGAVPPSGTRQVFPGGTTTYTLTARSSNAGNAETRSVTVTMVTPPPAPPKTQTAPETGASITSLIGQLQDIYFDYDMSELRDDAKRVLDADVALLRQIFAAKGDFTLLIQGHCDERGSAEYNLGLGDRRATITRDLLVQAGIPQSRIKTISLGEEQPVCTDENEACYQRNRRAHLMPAE
jgi:peptidoglycan-associated lipoprotein